MVQAIFERCGMAAADADVLADQLVMADLRGIHSHGVMRVPLYVSKLNGGGIDPRGRPRVVKDAPAALVIDGGNNMGQIAGAFAMQAAIERARTTGVAVAAVGNSNHCGAMEYYVRMAIAADMIGIATTNALPTMAPWGGIDKLVGLNPIGIGIPAGEEAPLVLDFAFGATAHGRMQVYQQKGIPIPEGWAFDQEGRPTTDIEKALAGLVQPIGMYKGIGLAMAAGILSTLLSGAGYGTESGNMVDGADRRARRPVLPGAEHRGLRGRADVQGAHGQDHPGIPGHAPRARGQARVRPRRDGSGTGAPAARRGHPAERGHDRRHSRRRREARRRRRGAAVRRPTCPISRSSTRTCTSTTRV